MKIVAFETRNDELPFFDLYRNRTALELICTDRKLTIETLNLLDGACAVSILGQSLIERDLIDELKRRGIRHVSTRTIGTNHIDKTYAAQQGIQVSNISYAPDCVAEFTLMMMLLSLRKYKAAMFRGNVNDYSLMGLQGREIKHSTVGVVGTGAIGAAVIRLLYGFGARILAHSPTGSVKEELSEMAEFVSLETLFAQSDIITLHVPLLESTRYLINAKSLSAMKDGVTLVNCSRGELIEINDLIEAVESCKVGAVALDVFEDEVGIYHHDRRNDIIANRTMAYLRQFPNVVMTQHMAFYTQTTIESMVCRSMDALLIAGI